MPIGPSTTQTPYILSSQPNVTFVSLLSVGDSISGAMLAGKPDGIGAFDLGNGKVVVTLNHEIIATLGAVRAHGAVGAFVSKIVIDKTTLAVESLSDLATQVMRDTDGDGIYSLETTTWAKFCSADLAAQSAFYNPLTNKGTTDRIHLTGEEVAVDGRSFAFVVTGADAGTAFELPTMGNMSFENVVANPWTGDMTLVAMQDDIMPGQVYFYIGTKNSTGANAVEKAGLLNGLLYGVSVTGLPLESNATSFASNTFALTEITGAKTMTGAQIDAASIAAGVTNFLRPEDGAWDPSNPSWYYFTTTNAMNQPSRLWRLEFSDLANPAAGGTIRMMLDGTEGQAMLDNLTITADGKVYVVEDPGNDPRLARLWMYDPVLDRLSEIARHDSQRFVGTSSASFNQDEESSGILDVSAIFGNADRQAFLMTTMAHYSIPGELVSGGQLQLMYVERPRNGGVGDDVINGGVEDDVLSGNAGLDSMRGGSGADRLYGDDGDDTVLGEQGDDILFGGAGNDSLRGSVGADALDGGAGNDLLFGGDDSDTLTGGSGDDSLDGIAGNDEIFGGEGADTMIGGLGADSLFGEQNNDLMFGFDGADILRGGLGNDTLRGEQDADLLGGDEGDDLSYGGAGADTLWGWTGNDTLWGGAEADLAFGDDGTDSLFGEDGADTFLGGAGDDLLFGWFGADVLWGGAGQDILRGEQDADILLGDDGLDTLFGGLDNDTLYGWTGNDVLWGENGGDSMLGEDGDDTFIGGLGSDTMTGGLGADWFFTASFEIADGEIDRITSYDATDRYLFQTGANVSFNITAAGAALQVSLGGGGSYMLEVAGATTAQLQSQVLYF
jgi:Ca2+-binding RTX toxin-like protein